MSMNFKMLLPDFKAIGQTNWAKPEVNFKDVMGLIALGGVATMLLCVFLPWCTVSFGTWRDPDVYLGITTWYGIFAFLFTSAAAVALLYKHYALALWIIVTTLLFAVIGCFAIPGDYTLRDLDWIIELGLDSHIGAVLFLLSTLVAGVGAFFKAIGK